MYLYLIKIMIRIKEKITADKTIKWSIIYKKITLCQSVSQVKKVGYIKFLNLLLQIYSFILHLIVSCH